MAGAQVLLRQVGAAGDQATGQVVIGDGLEQGIELLDTEALAQPGFDQAVAVGLGELVGALDLDGVDGEAAGIGCSGGDRLRGLLAWQVAQFFKAALLFEQQAVLALADQILLARGRCENGYSSAKAQSQKAQPHREVAEVHELESLSNITVPSLAGRY